MERIFIFLNSEAVVKLISRVVCLTATVLTPFLSVALDTPAVAQRVTSPSVRAAARLKNHPPKNWIRHYLGEDRYKIAGGVWKVVSTETDRYYYPPWAPEMLRQAPGIVIGFASIAEAEEAGYLPSPYPMDRSLHGLTADEIIAAKKRLTNAQNAGKRITLSDGRSTVILPKGWKHTRMNSGTQRTPAGNVNSQLDILTTSDGKSGFVFSIINLPGNINVEPFLTPDRISQLQKQLESDAANSQAAHVLRDIKFQSGSLGGMRGLSVIPGRGAQLPPGMSGRLTVVGRGSKLYVMAAQLPSRDTNYGVVVNSFQAH